MSKENVLVAGASGTTGNIIINLLKDSTDYNPIAMVRKKEQVEDFKHQGVSTFHADLEEEINLESVRPDIVVFAAGSKGKKVVEVDQEGAKKLIDASKKEGVKKFVMLSSVGADNPEVSEDLKDYLKAKQNADNHLKNSGLEYSIVRPGSLTDEKAQGNIKLRQKLEKQGSIPRADVAKTIVEVLHSDRMKQQTFEIISGETPINKAVDTGF
jgi:uncharacterized protein YbjT (DUF2867 family)